MSAGMSTGTDVTRPSGGYPPEPASGQALVLELDG